MQGVKAGFQFTFINVGAIPVNTDFKSFHISFGRPTTTP